MLDVIVARARPRVVARYAVCVILILDSLVESGLAAGPTIANSSKGVLAGRGSRLLDNVLLMVSALWSGALSVLRSLRYSHRLLTQYGVGLEFLSCGVWVIRIIDLLCCA